MSVEYYNNLPKKRMASGALILNEKDEILMVKPSYKDHWGIVGGVVDEDESPRDALIREAKEEIGVELKETKFLCVEYRTNRERKEEGLQFVFYGGKLNENEIKSIKLDGKEITEYKFLKIEDALPLLSKITGETMIKSYEALKNGNAIYLEDGK